MDQQKQESQRHLTNLYDLNSGSHEADTASDCKDVHLLPFMVRVLFGDVLHAR